MAVLSAVTDRAAHILLVIWKDTQFSHTTPLGNRLDHYLPGSRESERT